MKATIAYQSASVVMKIEGLEEINRRLDQLDSAKSRRLLVDAMKLSMKSMMAAAEGMAPIGPRVERTNKKSGGRFMNLGGILKRSFKIVKPRSSNPFMLEVRIINFAYYARWVEYGHRIVNKYGPAKKRTHTSPVPFMRPAFESQKEAAIRAVTAAIGAALTRRGV